MVALLVPGIGEEDVGARKAVRGDHVAHHLDRVVLDDAYVAQAGAADLVEQAADARVVHLDAEVVVFGVRRRDLRRAFAHPEADLDDQRRAAAESGGRVEPRVRIRDAERRQQRVVGPLLRLRDPPLPQHEAADVPCVQGFVARIAAAQAGLPGVIRPAVGELGVAL